MRTTHLFVAMLCFGPLLNAQPAGPAAQWPATTEVMPRVPSDTPHPPMSDAERQAMRQRKGALLAAANAAVNNNPPSPPGRPLVRDPQTGLSHFSALALASPDTFVLGKSVLNPNVVGKTQVVEPAI